MPLNSRLLLDLYPQNEGVHWKDEENEHDVAVDRYENVLKVVFLNILVLHWDNRHLDLSLHVVREDFEG